MKIDDENGYFKDLGITGLSNIEFQKENLIIGKNGSGKSRFLKGLIKHYNINKKNDDRKLIYADFTIIPPQKINYDGPDIKKSLFELYLEKSRPESFTDFLAYVLKDGNDFIEDILSPKNNRYSHRREQCSIAIGLLNDLLLNSIGRTVDITNKQISFKKENGDIETFEQLQERMSPGERVLFSLSIFIFFLSNVYGKKSKFIIILDEPELHLHTKALLNFISSLKDNDIYEELWIASHSYSLIPLFTFDNLIYIEDGCIQKRSSKLYPDIYNDLIGFEHKDLYDFLVSLSNWEYYNFIAECFCLPKSKLSSNTDDPQFLQFISVIKQITSKKLIRVLDYGGGKGRIGQCLKSYQELHPEISVLSRIEYDIYEPHPDKDTTACCSKLYTNKRKLLLDCANSQKKYDVIILMNVLHEIDVVNWSQIFDHIDCLLSKSGYLFFVEAMPLSHGEQPYGASGYIVLGIKQLEKLFGKQGLIPVDYQGDNSKSQCCLIMKEALANITDERIIACLESLQKETLTRLKEENEKRIKIAHHNHTAQSQGLSPRNYGYYSQLYINTFLALERIKNHDPFSEMKYYSDLESPGTDISYQNHDPFSDVTVVNMLSPNKKRESKENLTRLTIKIPFSSSEKRVKNDVMVDAIRQNFKTLGNGAAITEKSDKEILLCRKNGLNLGDCQIIARILESDDEISIMFPQTEKTLRVIEEFMPIPFSKIRLSKSAAQYVDTTEISIPVRTNDDISLIDRIISTIYYDVFDQKECFVNKYPNIK